MEHAKRRARVALLLGMLMATGCGSAQDRPADGDVRYDALLSAGRAAGTHSPRDQVREMEAAYWRLFPAVDLQGEDTAELDLELRAARVGAMETGLPDIGRRALGILRALEARHAATPQRIAATFEALVATAQFDVADQLARTHPDAGLAPIPGQRTDASFDAKRPAEWVLAPDATAMTRRAVPFETGLRIVVVAHPLCHFSQNAVAAIARDAGLAETFAHHARWITPPLRESDFAVIAEWNREHPTFAMTSVYDPNRWEGFDFRETPVFYFLVDGRIRRIVTGWPGDAQLSELKQAVAAASAPPPALHQDAASTRR